MTNEEASISTQIFEKVAEEPEAPALPEDLESADTSEVVENEQIEPAKDSNKPQLFPDAKTGDLVTFGKYEQDNNSEEKEPITWRILDIKDNRALLISEKILEPRYYESSYRDITWESSSIRWWLNRTFLNDAFSIVEQMQIREVTLSNKDNPEYGIDGGNNTKDHIFLLTISDADKYFPKRSDRTAQATEFAKRGLGAGYIESSPYYGNYSWWLRTPGIDNDTAATVYGDGYIIKSGDAVDHKLGVRPAIWVNMDLVVEEIAYTPISDPVVGQIVSYGRYEQDNQQENGREPLTWRVLAVEDNKALLISEKTIVARKYGGKESGTTWEKCTLREWLNETFLNNSFIQEEQQQIATTLLNNEDNDEYEIEGGNDTEDMIFLLSYSEAMKYFSGDEDRATRYTEYAGANNGNATWWLRTPGSRSTTVMLVNYSGSIDTSGMSARNFNASVRPVFWVNIE